MDMAAESMNVYGGGSFYVKALSVVLIGMGMGFYILVWSPKC